jgi:hypothetical protein
MFGWHAALDAQLALPDGFQSGNDLLTLHRREAEADGNQSRFSLTA